MKAGQGTHDGGASRSGGRWAAVEKEHTRGREAERAQAERRGREEERCAVRGVRKAYGLVAYQGQTSGMEGWIGGTEHGEMPDERHLDLKFGLGGRRTARPEMALPQTEALCSAVRTLCPILERGDHPRAVCGNAP